MEVNEDGFLEELFSLGKDTSQTDSFLTTNWWEIDTFQEDPYSYDPSPILPNLSECFFSTPVKPDLDCSFTELFGQNHNHTIPETQPFPIQEELQVASNVEMAKTMKIPSFDMERKNKNKKKEGGQPSKNLMAERRRRKRLNDRLSMLRSIVPKISKMDRMSILGDTIDYMKELIEKINNMQREVDVSSSELNGIRIVNDQKTDDFLGRTSAKFDVERRKSDTLVEISCTGKSGLLLSTISTLEALGLEIEQCVISCFNDFSLYASCSEELQLGAQVSSENIKQELFRNAGYEGRCL